MAKEPIGRYLTAISRHLQTFINKRLEPYHIGGGQYLFFLSIYYHEGIYQDELSRIEHVDKITTSKMVKRLVEAGYVRKEDDPKDRRFSRLYLTEKGREVWPLVRRILDETTDVLISGFTREEEQHLRALLPRMLAHVAQYTRSMKNDRQFSLKLEKFKAEIDALVEQSDLTPIQQTAARLESLHFTPTLMLAAPHFLYFSKTDLLEEIDRVAGLTEQEIHEQGVEMKRDIRKIKLEQIGLLVYHFKLLTRLRQDDPEAWDEIDELYGDD